MVRFVCQEKYKTHIRAEAELSERTQFFSTGIILHSETLSKVWSRLGMSGVDPLDKKSLD